MMTEDEIESELSKIAAECFRKDAFPSMVVGDWKLPKTTPKTARREIQRNLSQIDDGLHSIGVRLKRLVDAMREQR